MRRLLLTLPLLAWRHPAADAASRVEILRSISGLPAHIAGVFVSRSGSSRRTTAHYFVFDRRGHAVYTVGGDAAQKIIEVGAEPGRVLDPTAFDIDPHDGSFVVADAPLGERLPDLHRERQPARRLHPPGARAAATDARQPGAERRRIAAVHGQSVLLNQPERGGS